MVKPRSLHVSCAMALLALAGCSKDESAPESAYGESTAPGPGGSASAGDETTTSAEYGAMKEPQASEAASAKASAMPEAEPQMRAFSDGQIIRILETVDTRGIEQAELAEQTSIEPRVIKFAAQMLRYHMRSKQRAERLAEQAQMSVEPSLLADELARQWDLQVERLRDADTDQIDAFYIDGQVAQHEAMLGLLESQLIQSAENDTLVAYLIEARAKTSDQLEDARNIQQELTRD